MADPLRQAQAIIRVDGLQLTALAVGGALGFIPLGAIRGWGARPWVPAAAGLAILLVSAVSFGQVFSAGFVPFIYFRF